MNTSLFSSVNVFYSSFDQNTYMLERFRFVSISNLFNIERFIIEEGVTFSFSTFCKFFQEMFDSMDAGPEVHRTKGCRT